MKSHKKTPTKVDERGRTLVSEEYLIAKQKIEAIETLKKGVNRDFSSELTKHQADMIEKVFIDFVSKMKSDSIEYVVMDEITHDDAYVNDDSLTAQAYQDNCANNAVAEEKTAKPQTPLNNIDQW